MGAGPSPAPSLAERRGAPLVDLRQDVRHGALLGGHDPLERRGGGAARAREEGLPVDGRRRAGHPGDGANLGDHGLQVLDRAAPRREDAHVGGAAQDPGPDLRLQARHEAERDQDRHHPHRHAQHGDAGDERDERLLPPRGEVAQRDAELPGHSEGHPSARSRAILVIPSDSRLPGREESAVSLRRTPADGSEASPSEIPRRPLGRAPRDGLAACAGTG